MSNSKSPRTRDRWETEFLSGKWKFLRSQEEQARLKVVCEMALRAVPDDKPLVLFDLGSGEGLLAEHMESFSPGPRFKRYVAVDIAQAALDGIADKMTETHILRASLAELSDAQIVGACSGLSSDVTPVIVANEVLTYDEDSVQQLERIAGSVSQYFDAPPIIIVSCVGPHPEKPNWTSSSKKLWRELAELELQELDRQVVRNSDSDIFWDLVAYRLN